MVSMSMTKRQTPDSPQSKPYVVRVTPERVSGHISHKVIAFRRRSPRRPCAGFKSISGVTSQFSDSNVLGKHLSRLTSSKIPIHPRLPRCDIVSERLTSPNPPNTDLNIASCFNVKQYK
jgi:hypothetical protein